MARYIKAIDAWQYGEAIRNGQIKLQPGQWIRLGENGTLSRYYKTNGSVITAFHYPNATKRFRQYVAATKQAAQRITNHEPRTK
jgi:hypothetical protein